MINLLIADDDFNTANQLAYRFAKQKDYKILDICENGLDTIMSYKIFKPDVLLLDLDMPGFDGLQTLDFISKYDNLSNVIILSGSDIHRNNIQNAKKVFWIEKKPYDFNKICNLIKEIKTDTFDNNIEQELENLFKKLGFDINRKGTLFLKDSILFSYREPILLNKIEHLINTVAMSYKKNPKSVRSSIDKCINSMFDKHTDTQLLVKHFPDYVGDKPTTKVFINYSVKYLQNIQKNNI